MKHYTSIEQSKKLLELGLNTETADMYWFRDDTEIPKIFPKDMMKDSASVTLPCWSLGALLEMMLLPVLFMEIIGGCVTWVCEAHELDGKIIYAEIGIDAIEAVCNTMCWLLENNYIEK